jgi:TetR/AcrR family transcriptional regulator
MTLPEDLPRRGPGRPAGARSGEGREALLAAARHLMAEKGLPRVTAREVAERAGLQPALVNYYFGGKEGLLSAVVSEVAAEMLERVRAAVTTEGSVEERIRGLVEGIISAIAEDPYQPRLIIEQVLFAEDDVVDAFVESYGRPNLALMGALLAEGREAGAIRDLDPKFLMPSLMGISIFFFLAAPILQRVFGIKEITQELAHSYAEHASTLILHGITTSKVA